MKSKQWNPAILLPVLGISNAIAQGTFIVDQSAGGDFYPMPNGEGAYLQLAQQPFGQVFTPAMPEVGFITLNIADSQPANARGATIFVDLYTAPSGGVQLASTVPLELADGFSGRATFQFGSAVPVSSGVQYFFSPRIGEFTPASSGGGIVRSDDYGIRLSEQYYPGGQMIRGGRTETGLCIWFQEGIAVPEPSSIALFVLGGCMSIAVARHRSHSTPTMGIEIPRG